MTGPRPYAVARSEDDAFEELRRCAGTQFDPAVVEAFTAAWRDVRLAAAAARVLRRASPAAARAALACAVAARARAWLHGGH